MIALIGLPIVFLTASSVIYRGYQLSPIEKFERANGAATAQLQYVGAPIEQAPSGGYNYQTVNQSSSSLRSTPSAEVVTRLLGPGARVITRTTGFLFGVTRSGATSVTLIGVDYRDPIAAGLVHQRIGRPPASNNEVDVTEGLARTSQLRVGSQLTTLEPKLTLKVVGIVDLASTAKPVDEAFVLPGAIPPSIISSGGQTDFLASTPAPVTWAEVLRLDAQGFSVASRYVTAHPPPASAAFRPPANKSPLRKPLIIAGALLVGMALIEVVLLAGPALAVIARRQERSLALMAAAGAQARDLRNTVLAFGLVLGAAAAVTGLVLGVIAGAAALPVVARHTATRPGSFQVDPIDLTVLVAVSVVTALTAALAPARAASSIDVAASLGGRRTRRALRFRLPILSVALAGAGAAVALFAAKSGHVPIVIAGVALMEAALLLATPTLLVLTARLGRRLPLAPRLALRDAGRTRGSAAPAVAAVMAAVIGCVAVVAGAATILERDTRTYQPGAPFGEVTVFTSPSTGALVAAAMRANLPGSAVSVLSPIQDAQVVPSVPAGQKKTTRAAVNSALAQNVVAADPGDLKALTGVEDPGAEAALASGKVLVPDEWQVSGGMATFDVLTEQTATPVDGTMTIAGPQTPREVTVPAVALTRGFFPAAAIVPKSLAGRFGHAVPDQVVSYSGSLPRSTQLQALNRVLIQISNAYPDPQFGVMSANVERGFHDPLLPRIWLLGLLAAAIAVGAAGISTALSNADRSEDFLILESVGASPVNRRVVSAARAAVIALTGTLLGLAAGLVPVLAFITASNRSLSGSGRLALPYFGGPGRLTWIQQSERMHLVVPYEHLVLIIVGVPLVAIVLAGLLSRSAVSASQGPVSLRARLAP